MAKAYSERCYILSVDIVTHVLMGGVLASPLLETHPLTATVFAFGNVLPDLDALSRAFGKRAFLASHQTFTHSLPVIAVIGVAAALALHAIGSSEAWTAGLALTAGMALHAVLDWTNTFGITLLAPFSKKRFCREWVFFIDSVVIAATLPAIGVVGWRLATDRSPGWRLQAAYAAFLAAYWLLRVAMRRRAARLAPAGTLSLLPSALIPWSYLGCVREGDVMRIFEIDLLRGTISRDERVPVLDAPFAAALDRVPEVASMRHLSPAYHVVRTEAFEGGTRLFCRDLRTRNFNWAAFGAIDLEVGRDGTPRNVVFHV
jgi:membrane-bound metal-dependent hydrolase YbcI (DUF457 family)